MPLKKSLGLWDLIFYGSGTILGAGIFVVIGEVLGVAGPAAPIAYAIAGIVALFTALSFAEIAARIPSAGGPIDYSDAAFGRGVLPIITGWTLIAANIISGATITTGFASYLQIFAEVPGWMASLGLVLLYGAVAMSGIKQSAWFMTITSIIGFATLLVIIWVSRDALSAWPSKLAANDSWAGWQGVFAGAFLAIYSFIGFGDVALTAEEVKDVRKTLPRAMVITLLLVFVFYIAISATLGGRDDIMEIADSGAPLVHAVGTYSPVLVMPVAIASLIVIADGGLAQIVASSRLLMDLARDRRGAVPDILGRVNAKTGTPILATTISLAAMLLLALFVPLRQLAALTSLAILLVFVVVHASLWKLKSQGQPEDVPDMWKAVPIIGLTLSILTIMGQLYLWSLELGPG